MGLAALIVSATLFVAFPRAHTPPGDKARNETPPMRQTDSGFAGERQATDADSIESTSPQPSIPWHYDDALLDRVEQQIDQLLIETAPTD